MAHTLRHGNWISIANSELDPESMITIRKIDNDEITEGEDIEIPYHVIRGIVAQQVRARKIAVIGLMSTEELIHS